MIPKTIHQIHLGGQPLSDQEFKWQQTWKKYNPDWELILWDEDRLKTINIINEKHLDNCDNYAMKSDVLRLDILYQFGGLYIDTDFECLKKIDDFIKNKDFIICKQTPNHKHGAKVCNAFLAATQFNKIIKKLVYGIADRSVSHKNQDAAHRYGPFYLQDNTPEDLVLDSKYVYPFMWYETEGLSRDHIDLKQTFPESFAVHHWNLSWWN